VNQTDPAQPAADSCPDCHALVADLDAHKKWHSRLVSDIAKAVNQESKRGSAATA